MPIVLVAALTGLTELGPGGPAARASAVAPAATGSGPTLYAHDADGRVTAVFDGTGAGSEISYDKDGNIATVVVSVRRHRPRRLIK